MFKAGDIVRNKLGGPIRIVNTANTMAVEFADEPYVYYYNQAFELVPTIAIGMAQMIDVSLKRISELQLEIGKSHLCVPYLKCECGVDSVGGGNHSSYCPKSNIT